MDEGDDTKMEQQQQHHHHSQSPVRRYLGSLLHRKGRRNDSTKARRRGHTSSSKDRVSQLRCQEAISQSVENLLTVASGISLPPEATLHSPHRKWSEGSGAEGDEDGCDGDDERLVAILDRSGTLTHCHSLPGSLPNSPHPSPSRSSMSSSSSPAKRGSHGSYLGDNEDSASVAGSEHAWSGAGSRSGSWSDSPVRRPPWTDSNPTRTRGGHRVMGSFSTDPGDSDSEDDSRRHQSQSSLSTLRGIYSFSEDEDSDARPRPARLPPPLHQKGSALRFQESSQKQRLTNLIQHPFFMLEVTLKEGKDLVVRDSCGTSDPYVKFKIGSKQVFKSRTVLKNLNPQWNESFSVPIDDVQRPLVLKVYDYDRGLSDDPMGSAEIDLTSLEPCRLTDMKLPLSEGKKSGYMGYLLLSVNLVPKTQEDKESYYRRTTRTSDSKKLKMQVWSGVVTIVLVSGRNLVPMDDNGLSDPYVKFRLGNEKYRSKMKPKTLSPEWREQFDLRMYDDQSNQLEITVFDYDVAGKDDFMGRAVIDLAQLEREKTHVLDTQLEDGAGVISLLLTISGTAGSETVSDLANYTPNPLERQATLAKYSWKNSFKDFRDIGWLQVKVFKAQGLKAADFGGLSDPFCVLELVNSRLQTHTEYKTLNPEWNKVFTFNVTDIHSVLEVTVYDEDRDKKVEFLGRLAIPLLRIKRGERRWYALKDKKLLHKSKGAILLEMDLVFNNAKAAVRTVNPKEEKYIQPDQKFKISIMKRNIDRVTQLIAGLMEGGKFLQSCFDWESKPRSITAFIVFLVAVWTFELYMVPVSLLLLFLQKLVVAQIVGAFNKGPVEDDYQDEDDDDDEDDKDKKKKKKASTDEEKKSFKEKLQAIQDVCLQVQQGMDAAASMGERVKNTFNWTVPWLSGLAVTALSVGVVILYYIPIRYLILAWGINKFTKKLRKPNAIPNNELLDFLSRVPSDDELLQYRDLRPDFNQLTYAKKKRA